VSPRQGKACSCPNDASEDTDSQVAICSRYLLLFPPPFFFFFLEKSPEPEFHFLDVEIPNNGEDYPPGADIEEGRPRRDRKLSTRFSEDQYMVQKTEDIIRKRKSQDEESLASKRARRAQELEGTGVVKRPVGRPPGSSHASASSSPSGAQKPSKSPRHMKSPPPSKASPSERSKLKFKVQFIAPPMSADFPDSPPFPHHPLAEVTPLTAPFTIESLVNANTLVRKDTEAEVDVENDSEGDSTVSLMGGESVHSRPRLSPDSLSTTQEVSTSPAEDSMSSDVGVIDPVNLTPVLQSRETMEDEVQPEDDEVEDVAVDVVAEGEPLGGSPQRDDGASFPGAAVDIQASTDYQAVSTPLHPVMSASLKPALASILN